MKTITVNKRSVEVPVLHLRRGDTDSSVVRVRIAKDEGTQDIGLMTWSANIRNLGCEEYVSFIGLPVEEDETQVVLEWKIPKCVACVPGVSFVEFCGVRQEEGVIPAVWKSGIRHIEVHCDLPEEVLTEEEYFTVQQFIGEISQRVSEQLYTYQGEMREMDQRLSGGIDRVGQDILQLGVETGGEIEGIRTELGAHYQDINYLNENAVTKNENYIKKEPYGTRWNASILNLYGDYKHMDDGNGLVNGMDDTRKTQATYVGSDAAGMGIVMGTRDIADEYTAKVSQYGANHCIVSEITMKIPAGSTRVEVEDAFWERVKVNSVIHCYRTDGLEAMSSPTVQDRYNAMYGSDRYIGLVTRVDRSENKIYVNEWMKFNDLSAGGEPPAGQIPNDPYKNIVIDPIRKVWGENINLMIREPKSGVICEAGLYGEGTKKEGYDVILYNGGANYGFRARNSGNNPGNGTIKAGFIDQKSDVGFRSENPNEAGFGYYIDDANASIPFLKTNIKSVGDAYTMNARGIENMEGAEINLIEGTAGSTGAMPKKLYITSAAGNALRLSDTVNGTMTTILARHDVTLKGNILRIDNGSYGFKNVTEVAVKAGQTVRCLYNSGWYLTAEKAVQDAGSIISKVKTITNTYNIPSVPLAETYVVTGATYDINIENGIQNGDKCSLLVLASGTVRLLGALRIGKTNSATGFVSPNSEQAINPVTLKKGTKVNLMWYSTSWYMTVENGYAPEV